MYGRGNNGPLFRPTYPSSSPSSFLPPLQSGLPHASSNQFPPTIYSQPLPPSQPAHQPPMHMNPPSNYGVNPSYIPQTGNLNAQFIPPPVFPPSRVLPPYGVSAQDQFMYRHPHPPATGMYHAHPPPPSSFTASNPSPFVPGFHGAVSEAPLPSLPPDSPPPPPPSPPHSSSSPVPKSKLAAALKQEIVKDHESGEDVVHDSGNDGSLIESVKAEEVEAECTNERKERPGYHSAPPLPRPEEDVVQSIEKLCKLLVDEGPQYENLAREKEANNPSFSFLFGGSPGSADAIGYDYFNWMKRNLRLESYTSKTKSSIHVSTPPEDSAIDNKPTTPSESDMDMDDDESQPEDRQSISESSKESVKEFKSQPATEEQLTALSNITQKEFPEMPLADSPTCPALSPLDQEIHSKEVVPEMSLVDVPTLPASLSPGRKLCDFGRTPARNASVASTPAMQQRVTSLIENAATVESMEASPECVKDGSRLGLIEDYASDDSEGADAKDLNIPNVINQGKETSTTYHHNDGENDKVPCNDEHNESSLKVDEFGRMVKETPSSSGSEESYYEKRYARRGRSQSRSKSPQIKRRTRSPKSWRERRSPSPSWSPRGRNRQWDHRRRGTGPPQECYNFRKGRCFRGASCWYSHHDIGHSKHRNNSQDLRHMRREWSRRHESSLPDVSDREASKDTADLHSRHSFKGEGLSRDGSSDSIKDAGKHILPCDDASHKEFDLSGPMKVSHRTLMNNARQKSMAEPDDLCLPVPEAQKSPDVEDHVAHDALTQSTTAPQEVSEFPKILPTQEALNSQIQTSAGQPPSMETKGDLKYSNSDPGRDFIMHQKQDLGSSPFIQPPGLNSGDLHRPHQTQALQPPYRANPPFFPSFSLSMPESALGYRPQFSFLHGPKSAGDISWQTSRADVLPQLPSIDGFSAARPSLTNDYHSPLAPPKLPAVEPSWPLISHSHIQENTSTHFGPKVPSHSNLNADHFRVLYPDEERNPSNEQFQRPPSSGFPLRQPFGGNYFTSMENSKSALPPELPNITQQKYAAQFRPDVSSNNVTSDHIQGPRPTEERNPMNEFIQRPPLSGIPLGQSFEGNYFTRTEQSKSITPPEPPNIHSLQHPAAQLRPEISSHSSLIADRQVLHPAEQTSMSEFMQRPHGQSFEGNYMTQSNSARPPEPPNITCQGFQGTSASLPYYLLPNKDPHLSDVGLPKLPPPSHYHPLTFTSPRHESSCYDSSFVRGHSLGHHGLPNVASSSLIPEPERNTELKQNNPEGPPGSEQYDPLFDSIDPPSELDRSRASKAGNEEYGDMEVGAVENESPGSPIDFEGKGTGEVEVDQARSPGKTKKNSDSKSMKLLKIALANFVKEILKPSWRQGTMSKEAYKTIVKKTVEKVSGSVSGHHLPRSQAKIDHYVESSRRKLTKLVMGYVDKYVKR